MSSCLDIYCLMTHSKPSDAATAKKPHHHGNLHEALVMAGIELLEEGGLAALTLRKCAARAGVSHAAPQHHFNGVEGLKGAIATEGFRRFTLSMTTARDAGDPSPRGKLKSICRGYLQFAVENPGLFLVIFGVNAQILSDTPVDDTDGHGYLVLAETCAPFVPAGTPPLIIEAQVWSLVHGYTVLYLSGRFRRTTVTETGLGLFDQVMTLLDQVGTNRA
jgi:AcrR family transcriptional regulator